MLAAADALGWQRFGLLGHSLGGAIASVLAAACPERIERLLLIEALGPLAGEAEQALAQLQRALSQRGALQAKALRVFASEDEAARARVRRPAACRWRRHGFSCHARHSPVPGGFVWSSDPRLTLASPQRYVEARTWRARRHSCADADPGDRPGISRRSMINARIARVRGIEVVRIPAIIICTWRSAAGRCGELHARISSRSLTRTSTRIARIDPAAIDAASCEDVRAHGCSALSALIRIARDEIAWRQIAPKRGGQA